MNHPHRLLFCLLLACACLCGAERGSLTWSFIRNMAMNKPSLAPLADLADFSVRLLAWSGADRAAAVRVHRDVKQEASAQYHRGLLRLPVREGAALRDWINSQYASLRSPELLRLRITSNKIHVLSAPAPMIWSEHLPAELPVIANNVSDVRQTIRYPGGTLDLAPGETRGTYLSIVPEVPGKQIHPLRFTTEGATAEVPIAADVRETVQLRVKLLNASGQPTAARIYLTGSDTRSHVPEHSDARIIAGDYNQPFAGEVYFYAEGSFQIRVPAGKTKLEVVKGLEYRATVREFEITPQGQQDVTVRLERWADMGSAGWYSGDIHVHANAINHEVITPKNMMTIARAEDLNVAEVLVNNYIDQTVTDRQYFQGKPDQLSEGRYILHFGQEMRNATLYGHMAFLGLKKLVEPLYTGFPGSNWWEDYPANLVQALAAKRQGAVVTHVHPEPLEEYPVDFALGAMDALDVMSQRDELAIAEKWYQLLNCGIRCAISAGTDSFANIAYHLVPGANRVYVQSGPTLTYDEWINGYRRGRSFATNGPLISFTVDGQQAGGELRLQKPASVRVWAKAISQVPMDRLEIIVNGHVIHVSKVAGNQAETTFEVPLQRSSWIAARVLGGPHRLVPNDTRVFAHTSPVYCYLGGRAITSREDARSMMSWIDQLIERTSGRGRFASTEHRDAVLDVFRKGRQYYRAIAETSPEDSVPHARTPEAP